VERDFAPRSGGYQNGNFNSHAHVERDNVTLLSGL